MAILILKAGLTYVVGQSAIVAYLAPSCAIRLSYSSSPSMGWFSAAVTFLVVSSAVITSEISIVEIVYISIPLVIAEVVAAIVIIKAIV